MTRNQKSDLLEAAKIIGGFWVATSICLGLIYAFVKTVLL